MGRCSLTQYGQPAPISLRHAFAKLAALMRKRIGAGLVVAAYALLLYMSLAAPAYARAHPQLSAALLAEYAAPWPVVLASSLALVGMILAPHQHGCHTFMIAVLLGMVGLALAAFG